MRYSSALVLSTLAVGQAAAGAHHARHASFHARREAESKRDVDYANKDLYKDVNWSAINWNDVLAKAPKTTEAAAPSSTPEAVAVVETPAPSPEPTSVEAPSKTFELAQKKPEETKEAKRPLKDAIGKLVDKIEDLFEGIDDFCAEKGISGPGINDQAPNGGIWIGDSDWSVDFKNGGSAPVWVTCWQDNGFTGMTINVNRPSILIRIPEGDHQVVSFAPGAAAACAPMYPDAVLSNFGGVYNAWFEVTMGNFGAFDVSKNVRMKGGASISAVGSKCTSDMSTCCFECKDKAADSCVTDYDLINCNAGNGGGGGWDPNMGGIGGGCAMGETGEKITVTFTN